MHFYEPSVSLFLKSGRISPILSFLTALSTSQLVFLQLSFFLLATLPWLPYSYVFMNSYLLVNAFLALSKIQEMNF